MTILLDEMAHPEEHVLPMSIGVFGEIKLFPIVCADPFTHGGNVFLRLGLAHPVDGCDWEVNYEGSPHAAIAFGRVLDDVMEHLRNCPHAS
jgi:hypothetical protein